MTAQLRQCSRCRLFFPTATAAESPAGPAGWECAACAALGTPVAVGTRVDGGNDLAIRIRPDGRSSRVAAAARVPA